MIFSFVLHKAVIQDFSPRKSKFRQFVRTLTHSRDLWLFLFILSHTLFTSFAQIHHFIPFIHGLILLGT